MSNLGNMPVARMNGLGNEILILDLRAGDLAVSAAEARAIARAKNLAFDQLMVLHRPKTPGAEAFVRILNADGSEAGACGNGTRCVAWMLMRGHARAEITIETAAGALVCRRLGEWRFSVEMGAPRLEWRDIPLARAEPDTRAIDLSYGPPDAPILRNPAVVNMGNPHAIFFVDDIGAYDLAAIGPALEHDPIFPERANISLARVVRARPHRTQGLGARRRPDAGLRLRRLRRPRRRRATGPHGPLARVVGLPGGDLDILWRESDGMVVMEGPVAFEFETRLDPALFADVAA